MKHQKLTLIATSILAAVLIGWLLWMHACNQEQAHETIETKVQKQVDSVAIAAIVSPVDSAKLRKIAEYKKQLAARLLADSAARARNK